MIQRAVGVHEWCEIRLIRSEASEQGAVGFVRGIRSDLAFAVGFLVTF